MRDTKRKAISPLEVLAAIAIIALLMSILMPALTKARRNAKAMQTMNNQRQIVMAVTCFASDNNSRYPDSVATIGTTEQRWNWQEPTMLISSRRRAPNLHRAVSEYLGAYIKNASIMFCPNAPKKYKYLQRAWMAGDRWDNPQTPQAQDPLIGTYCLYWNYTGYLQQRQVPFNGPGAVSVTRKQSKVLLTDYFGYGHWRSPDSYSSCEKLRNARITQGTAVSSDYWSCKRTAEDDIALNKLRIDLHAGFTDGHVERYWPKDTVAMKVSMTPDGSVPYPDELGPGIFYLPAAALD